MRGGAVRRQRNVWVLSALFPTTGVFIKGFALWLHQAWWGSGTGVVQGSRSPFIATKGQLRTQAADAQPLS